MQTLRHIIIVLLAVSILSGCSRPPSEEVIKGDLIGREVGGSSGGGSGFRWQFESLSEFVTFSITNKTTQGDIIEYSVKAKLRKAPNMEGEADLRLVYRKENGAWKLANVSDTGALSDSFRVTRP